MTSKFRKILMATVASAVLPLGNASADGLTGQILKDSSSSHAVPSAYSGFYYGLAAGVGVLETKSDYSAANSFDTDYSNAPVNNSAVGGLLGLHAGYDIRPFGARGAVVGLLASYDRLMGFGTTTGGSWPDCPSSSCLATVKTDATDLFTIRGRVGFEPFGGTLLYGTAGYGRLHVNDTLNVTGTAAKGGNFHSSAWVPALVYGAGVEHMISSRMSLGFDLLRVNTSSVTASPKDNTYFPADTPPVQYNHDMTIGRMSLSIKY